MSEPYAHTGLVPSCLIIADGSIATLLAVWREAVCRPSDSENAKPALWAPANLAPQAAAANAQFVKLAGLPSTITGPLPATITGLSASLMLLAAGEDAAKRGIGRVVWPVQFAAADDATRLTQVAGAFDRALLAARLLSIDTRQAGGQSVLIHTPFAELNDNQLLDLAADMDAPVGSAWWCEKQAEAQQSICGRCDACSRWLAAMRHAGVAGPIAHLPSSLLEDKPAAKTAV
ncbi:MAG TPA: 7-cyano-7-deazaguanine synthase [Phycisphaerales bacterium]|nr:7-cyano-7-deazaguanine synthase [Phycisphaerales bacterium]